MWGKNYGSQTNVLHWDDSSSVLFVGLDSGFINRYECQKDKNLREMKELPEITVHNSNQRVMGISV